MRRIAPLATALAAAAAAAALAGCGGGGEEDAAAGEGGRSPAATAPGGTSPQGSAPRGTAPAPPPAAPLAERVRGHLDALAGIARDNAGTRAAGSPGGAASEAYVAGRLRALGWTVRQEEVGFDAFSERRPPVLRRAGRTYRPGREVASLTYSGAGTATGRLRAVRGLGCAPADHRAVRRGELALVTRGTCTLRRKAQLAAERGAAGVVVVNTEPGTIPGTLGTPALRLPVVGAAAAAGADLRRAEGTRVTVRVDARSGRQTSQNIVADAPWGDANQVVMAGAHLDSVDAGAGMNDNASGVAATLAAAERLTATPPADGARVRVAFWAAEELGLIGSRRHVERLDDAGRDAITAYVNLDMVGSPDGRAMVYGQGEVARALRGAVRAEGLSPEPTSIGSSSDHAPFRRAGIPVGGLFTGAGRPFDACYHRACDDRDNVDDALTADMAGAATRALRALASR